MDHHYPAGRVYQSLEKPTLQHLRFSGSCYPSCVSEGQVANQKGEKDLSVTLPMAQGSRGTIQNRPYPARTLKVMESAGQHTKPERRQTANDYEREGVVTTSPTASGTISPQPMHLALGDSPRKPGATLMSETSPSEPDNTGSRLSGHRLDLIGVMRGVCRSNTPLPNHRRPALSAGSRLTGKQVP